VLVLFSGVACFKLCGYMNMQKNRFLILMDEVPLCNVKLGVGCGLL
jgi:hypothetical protein